MQVLIDRYHPDTSPYTQCYDVDESMLSEGMMLLQLLQHLREQDPSLGFRSSCQEGVCGSDGMNINGKNGLSCITLVRDLGQRIHLRPLPGFAVIKDLIVDLGPFYQHYQAIKPRLAPEPSVAADLGQELLQTPEERAKLDGSYECILCGCCSSSCPSFWWNPDLFPGPAALLAVQRFVVDSRDIQRKERLEALNSATSIFRCRHIQNCTAACPKGLNPSRAIQALKHELLSQ
ncbi:MAG: succinate dehydrogenase iron-sulfur subunit [Thiotrichales bacterium]|nr:succinate dehydrogenase iron-sulfur subunit [Thiotrichales bacterium]